MLSSRKIATKWYLFGMLAQNYNAKSYRFWFNTQERTDEISGTGNHNTALFWKYNTPLGRRWNLDPKPQVFISDYAVLGNNPLSNIDVLGDKIHGTYKEKRALKRKVKSETGGGKEGRKSWKAMKSYYKGNKNNDNHLYFGVFKDAPLFKDAKISKSTRVRHNNSMNNVDYFFYSKLTKNKKDRIHFWGVEGITIKPSFKMSRFKFSSGTISIRGVANLDGFGEDNLKIFAINKSGKTNLDNVVIPKGQTVALPFIKKIDFNFPQSKTITFMWYNKKSPSKGAHAGYVKIEVNGKVVVRTRKK